MPRFVFIALALTLAPLRAPSQTTPQLPTFDRRTPIVLAVENVGPAVVNLRTLSEVRDVRRSVFRFSIPGDDPDVPRGFANRSMGSGVIFHPAGWIITNNHVVRGADRIVAKLRDGREVPARLINTSPGSDIAILKLEQEGPFPYALLGSSDDAMVGETTIAMGNPFGLSNSVTSGILSAKDRPLEIARNFVLRTLQTSALINPGNSGGPLCDINGRVIGISVAIDRRGPGIGYAIPIDKVKEVAQDLLSPELTKVARLGLSVDVVDDELVATEVMPNGPAAKAGAQVGMRLAAVGDEQIATPLEFYVRLQEFKPGDRVPLSFRTSSGIRSLAVPLEPIPLAEVLGNQGSGWGMTVAELTPRARRRLRIPVEVDGLLITGVKEGSPAAEIQLQDGDILVQVGMYGMRTLNTFRNTVQAYRARRGSIKLRVYREGPTGGNFLEGRILP